MQPIKIILVPTDFSPASQRALRYACNLAEGVGASLHVVYVMQNPVYSELYLPPSGDYLEELEKRSRAELQDQLNDAEKRKYCAVFVLRVGDPAHQILEYLNEQPAIDLVVMATAGRGGVARLMMGSVADRIVRAAPCPVLTIHPPDRAEPGSTYRAA
jgi:nucleotide-binding universal stress UspA family protein